MGVVRYILVNGAAVAVVSSADPRPTVVAFKGNNRGILLGFGVWTSVSSAMLSLTLAVSRGSLGFPGSLDRLAQVDVLDFGSNTWMQQLLGGGRNLGVGYNQVRLNSSLSPWLASPVKRRGTLYLSHHRESREVCCALLLVHTLSVQHGQQSTHPRLINRIVITIEHGSLEIDDLDPLLPNQDITRVKVSEPVPSTTQSFDCVSYVI